MVENEEKLALSVHETAEILGVSVPTAYELARRADFPAFHVTLDREAVWSRM